MEGFGEKVWSKHDLKVRVMKEALWWKFGGGQLEELPRYSGNLMSKVAVKCLRSQKNRIKDQNAVDLHGRSSGAFYLPRYLLK